MNELSSFVLQKRCLNCNKLFGLKRYSTGKQEFPCNFKTRKYCCRSCSSIAAAQRRQAEKSA
jgi:hypothetical protein